MSTAFGSPLERLLSFEFKDKSKTVPLSPSNQSMSVVGITCPRVEYSAVSLNIRPIFLPTGTVTLNLKYGSYLLLIVGNYFNILFKSTY